MEANPCWPWEDNTGWRHVSAASFFTARGYVRFFNTLSTKHKAAVSSNSFQRRAWRRELTTGGAIDAGFIVANEWQRAHFYARPHLCMYNIDRCGHEKHFDSHCALFCNTFGPNSRVSYELFIFFFCVCLCVQLLTLLLRYCAWSCDESKSWHPSFWLILPTSCTCCRACRGHVTLRRGKAQKKIQQSIVFCSKQTGVAGLLVQQMQRSACIVKD